MEPVAEHVTTFPGLLVGRVYCIEDADGLTLIDAGLGLAAKRILSQLGDRARQVRRILITHAHADHVGGLHALHAATGAEVYASAPEKEVIEGRIDVPRAPGQMPSMLPSRFTPTPVTQVVADGDTIPGVLGGLQVIGTPGHAPGHISFWQPTQRILFCGDVLFHMLSRHPTGLRLPFAGFTVDVAQNKQSVHKIAALDPAIICFGHGQPLKEDAAGKLHAFAAELK